MFSLNPSLQGFEAFPISIQPHSDEISGLTSPERQRAGRRGVSVNRKAINLPGDSSLAVLHDEDNPGKHQWPGSRSPDQFEGALVRVTQVAHDSQGT